MSTEPQVSADLYSALKERLRTGDKQDEIELYYELPRKWSVERVRSCGFGLGFEGDLIAEAFEAAFKIGNNATLADLVEIGVSEIAIDYAPGEHVIAATTIL